MAREPEADLTRYLLERLPLDAVLEFYRRFGGYRIPKRPAALVEAQRRRIVLSVAVRLAPRQATLTSAQAVRVAEECFTTVETVRNVWSCWQRRGRGRLKDETTDDATDARATTWR